MRTFKAGYKKMISVLIMIMMVFQITAGGMQYVYGEEEITETEEQKIENVAEEKKEDVQETEETKAPEVKEDNKEAETPAPETKDENTVNTVESRSEAEAAQTETAENENTEEAPAEEEEEEEEITVQYDLKTPANASFVPEIKGIEGNSETVKANGMKAYTIRSLSRNLYQTQADITKGKISYEFMGWKTESGKVVEAASTADLETEAKTFDKNKDGIVKLNATWNNTFGFNSEGKYRYTTFSIYNTGKVPTAVDNNAGNYVSGIYGTVAYPGDAKEPLMKNWKSAGDGRVVVNQDSNGIGVDAADEMIRGMVDTPVSNYFDSRNGNEEAGYTEYEISIMDFPTDEEVFEVLRRRIEGGLTLKVIIDGETKKITKTENYEDFDTAHYTVKWFSVKYQNNGIHIDGIVIAREIAEPEPAEEPAAETQIETEPEEEPAEEPQAEEEPEEQTEEPEAEPQAEEPAAETVEESVEETQDKAEPEEEPAAETTEEPEIKDEPEAETQDEAEPEEKPEAEQTEEPQAEEEPEEEPEEEAQIEDDLEVQSEAETPENAEAEEEPEAETPEDTDDEETATGAVENSDSNGMNGTAGSVSGANSAVSAEIFAGIIDAAARAAEAGAQTAEGSELTSGEIVENNAVPQAAAEPEAETIEDHELPQGVQTGAWSIMNLILMALTIIAGLFSLTRRFLGIVPPALSVIVFILTEDITKKMVLADAWTFVMAMLFIAAVFMILKKDKKENEESSDIAAQSQTVTE